MSATAGSSMRIYRHLSDIPQTAHGGVVAIGNFDGVHRGHQAVIGEAVRLARAAGRPASILTFDPHPRRFFRPDGPPFLITRFRTKARVLGGLGIDVLAVLRFNAALAAFTAEQFIATALIGGLACSHVVVGADFVFGRGRQGNSRMLRERLAEAGIATTIMSAVTATGNAGAAPVISSTAVRDCLAAGDPRGAARLLGRNFAIEGHVRRGDQRGRTIGFPTANVWLGEYLRPALGVYAVRVQVARSSERWSGVANLGLRPTFGGEVPRLEVHLFDFAGDLYGRNLCVELIEFLRPERKFDGLAALKAQIERDAAAARAKLLDAVPPAFI